MQAQGHAVCLVVYGAGMGADDSGLEIVRGRRLPGDTKTAAGPSFVKPLLDAALVATLRRTVRARKIDAVIAHNYEALIVALTARACPVIYHAHNAMADELPHYFGGAGWARRAGAWIDRQFPKRANAVLAPHARIAEYLVECGCAGERVHEIPPIASVEAFDAGNEAEGIAPVLYTGNLDPYQNLGLLSRAFGLLREQNPNARLLVATAESNAHFGSAEILHTPDFPSVRARLAMDAVVAVPRVSWSGYPVKLLNAMAAGKACVACASSAWPITHEHDGLVVPDNDAATFAEALTRLTHDAALRRRFGANARATIAEKHDAAVVTSQIEDVVRTAAGA